MTDFQQIYFDSSVFIGNGWPGLSAKLQELLRLAHEVQAATLVPEVVLREMEAHWLREFKEKNRRAGKGAKELQDFVGKVIDLPVFPQPPNVEHALERYRATVSSVLDNSAWEIQCIPTSERQVKEFLDMAFDRLGPFDEKGRGFQDAVILMSIIDHLSTTASKEGVLLAGDSDFNNESKLGELTARHGVQLLVLRSPDEVLDNLTGRLQKAKLLLRARDNKQALESLQADLISLSMFIKLNLQVRQGQIPVLGRLAGIRAVRVVKIERVSTTYPLEGETTKQISLSADVRIELLAVGERFLMPPPKYFKVGQMDERAPTLERRFDPAMRTRLLNSRQFENVIGGVAEVEAAAVKEGDRYVQIEYKSVRLKSHRRGGLTADAVLRSERQRREE